ncbi:glycosyltransferase family protein [Portibacter marinus]|uniref:glycosyltransferase family 2 protein n=1 Tax=Portibacter marinus TaxID=2898660 RepID=UPI001F37B7A8|nr:glycosyltransferase family 2 protein [Portibacter marinus]
MKVSGFTFIRNAILFDYPIVESIQSILPLCDEMIVAVGQSEDETRDLIAKIDSTKIKIIDTIWDDDLREGGQVLAVETDKAFKAVAIDSDWAFYLQGDEIVHEKYLPTIKKAMIKYQDDAKVDGLLFKYLHFYGSYDYIGLSSNWYKNEIRVIKNNASIYSYRDAQGFRKGKNEKLNVVAIDAYIYHYGWVKPPATMQRKQLNFNKLWHNDEWVEHHIEKVKEYDYQANVSELARFKEDHPQVMRERISKTNWEFEHDIAFNKRKLKDRFKSLAIKILGIDFNYKNYHLVEKDKS